MAKLKLWYCSSCKAILGHIEDNICRIKRKDLYVEITEADKTFTVCYKCGKPQAIQNVQEAPSINQKKEGGD